LVFILVLCFQIHIQYSFGILFSSILCTRPHQCNLCSLIVSGVVGIYSIHNLCIPCFVFSAVRSANPTVIKWNMKNSRRVSRLCSFFWVIPRSKNFICDIWVHSLCSKEYGLD
jgi:hypothetical protein